VGDQNPNISRRKAIKATATVSSLPFLSQPVLGETTQSETVDIPVVKHRGKVVHSKEFPKEWKEEIDNVRGTYDEVKKTWADIKGVKEVNRVRSDEEVNGRNLTQLNVEIVEEEYEGGIPDEVNGVPVQISEWNEPKLGGACENNQDYSDIPGGVVNGTGSGSWGTACCRIWDGDKYTLMTAYHIFSDSCGDSVMNEVIHQHGQEVGPIDTQLADGDFVLAKDNSSSVSLSQDVMTQNGRVPMKGAVTDLDALMSDYEGVQSTGCSTGYTSGYVDAYPITGSGCYDFNDEGVRTTCESAQGDSGGPTYYYYQHNDTEYRALVHQLTYLKGSDTNDDVGCNNNDIYTKRNGISGKYLENSFNFGIGTK